MYRGGDKDMREGHALNPKSTNKKIYKLVIIGTITAIAAIASIISIFI